MYFSSLLYNAYAQQNKMIDMKAEKAVVDSLCADIKQKVDNETLLQMLEVLKVKYANIEKVNDEQNKRLDYQREIQAKQLETLKNIEIEIIKLNKNRGK